jgi:hypothetical protein
VNEGDPATVSLRTQGPQHRHHRRDAAATGHEQDALRPLRWENEVAAD